MGYVKHNFQPGDILEAEHLNKMEDGIVATEGSVTDVADFIQHAVESSNTQPTSNRNRIWYKSSGVEEIEVPTRAAFENQKAEITQLKSDLSTLIDDSINMIDDDKIEHGVYIKGQYSQTYQRYTDFDYDENSTYKTIKNIHVKSGINYVCSPCRSLGVKLIDGTFVSLMTDNQTSNYEFSVENDAVVSVTFYETATNIFLSDKTKATAYTPYVRPVTTWLKQQIGADELGERMDYNLDNMREIRLGTNLIDASKATSGYISANTGTITDNSNYKTSEYIELQSNKTYYLILRNLNGNYATTPRRIVLLYDADKQPVASTYVNIKNVDYIEFSSSTYAYARVSWDTNGNTDTAQLNVDSISPYEPYRVEFVNKMTIEQGCNDSLYGKKWVACGDSFTHGDFGSAPVDNYHITGGKYSGQLKVYPYIIGNRTGMVVVNEAVNGSTITNLGTRQDAFSIDRYKQIPSDADYITLKFGINDDDGHQNAPIGTIDDTTTGTFYGAWNVVMQYLIENHPNAHIGIIITNGAKKAYCEAEIAIAKKWGVGYLNEGLGDDMQVWYRSARTDVANIVKTTINNQFRVSETNSHPNSAWHEKESYAVENWLRGL